MTNKEYQTAAQVTDAMIQEWERKFNCKVRSIEVPIGSQDEKPRFFLRKPDRVILNQLTRLTGDKDYEKANETLIKNCVLGGDMQYLDTEENGGNDEVYYSVLDAVGDLVEKKKAIFLN